jgi:type IX secretion system substrate protein
MLVLCIILYKIIIMKLLAFLICFSPFVMLSQVMTNWSLTNSVTLDFVHQDGTNIDNADGNNPALPTASGARALGFDFWYMGVRYTQANYTNFGTFSLGASAVTTKVNDLTNHPNGRPILAPLWDNIEIDDGNSARIEGVYENSSRGYSGERKHSVTWEAMEWDQSEATAPISFRCVLHETGEIEFQYSQETAGWSPSNPLASMGFTAVGTGSGNFVSVNGSEAISTTIEDPNRNGADISNMSSTTDASYLFSPINKCIAPFLTSATTISSSQIDITWTDNSNDELGFAVYYSIQPEVPLDAANFFSYEPANSTSKSITGLSGCSKYYFKVLAIKESYTPSNILNATTSVGAGTDYYVNDGTLNGSDIYTTNIGSVGNTGLTPASPKSSISAIISSYVLTSGDRIFVDAGTFAENVVVTSIDDGSGGCPVRFIGVDSSLTIINSAGGIPLTFSNVDYVSFENFKILGNGVAEDAVELNGGSHCQLTHCWIINQQGGNESAIDMGGGPSGSLFHTINNSRIECGIGGGIDLDGATAPAAYNEFGEYYDNIIIMSGGGAFGVGFYYSNHNKVFRNRISGNGYGLYFDGSANGDSDYNQIYNNYISAFVGFYNDKPNSNIGRLQYNSFYTTSHCLWFDNTSGGQSNWVIKNNIFYTTASSTSEYCVQFDGAAKIGEIDCNWYYYPNGARCAQLSLNYATLTAWKGVDHSNVNNGDENSGGGNSGPDDPKYSNSAINDLDLLSGSPCFASGCPINVSEDIYFTPRSSTPSIGAYEEISTLPIKLVSFSVDCYKMYSILNWKTSVEINNDYFVVEKAGQDFNFEPLAYISGAGNSSVIQNYIFEDDTKETDEVSYYRLKQVDFNGEYSYSNIIASKCDNTSDNLSVYPNPVNDVLNLKGNIEQIELYDVSGNLVKQQLLNPEDSQYRISTGNINSGIYLLKIRMVSGKVDFKKISISH